MYISWSIFIKVLITFFNECIKYFDFLIYLLIEMKLWIICFNNDFFFFEKNLIRAFYSLLRLWIIFTFFILKNIWFAKSRFFWVYFENDDLIDFALFFKSMKCFKRSIVLIFRMMIAKQFLNVYINLRVLFTFFCVLILNSIVISFFSNQMFTLFIDVVINVFFWKRRSIEKSLFLFKLNLIFDLFVIDCNMYANFILLFENALIFVLRYVVKWFCFVNAFNEFCTHIAEIILF